MERRSILRGTVAAVLATLGVKLSVAEPADIPPAPTLTSAEIRGQYEWVVLNHQSWLIWRYAKFTEDGLISALLEYRERKAPGSNTVPNLFTTAVPVTLVGSYHAIEDYVREMLPDRRYVVTSPGGQLHHGTNEPQRLMFYWPGGVAPLKVSEDLPPGMWILR